MLNKHLKRDAPSGLLIMNEKQEKKPLSSRAIEAMKPGELVMTDSGENRGLRVICGNAGM